MSKKLILIILDGWGEGSIKTSSAIAAASTPYVDSLYKNYPHARLITYGAEVGLPNGQMGNSEVGHLNIGAGRIVYQELQRINVAIESNELKENAVLNEMFKYCIEKQKPLHLIGLVSDGGIHSHINHLKSIIAYAHEAGVKDIFIHAFTDGRDTDPESGLAFISDIDQFSKNYGAHLNSVCGRYYGMDRDKRWERVKLAYDMLVHGQGERTDNFGSSISKRYSAGETDEFIKPIIAEDYTPIQDGDAVFCFNFRTDRCREITEVLTQEDKPEFHMAKMHLNYITMTKYSESFVGVKNVFNKDNLKMTLGEEQEKNNKSQVRIAETEKYPHVTFFFSGGREQPFHDEKRIMIPSPKVATYDLQPEMSAKEIAHAICEEMDHHHPDFICLNFANPDMVGHTGVFSAAVKAIETVDHCLQKVMETALKHDYNAIIIADHGNADYMINEDGSPNTAHTKNPVPVFAISKEFKQIKDGKLGDIAPTILKMMQIPIPSEMFGNILVG